MNKTIQIFQKRNKEISKITRTCKDCDIYSNHRSKFYSMHQSETETGMELESQLLNCKDRNKINFQLSREDIKLVLNMDQDEGQEILFPHITKSQIDQALKSFKELYHQNEWIVCDMLRLINLVGMNFKSNIQEYCLKNLQSWISYFDNIDCWDVNTHFVKSFGQDLFVYFKQFIDEVSFDYDECILQSYKLTYIISNTYNRSFGYRLFQCLWESLDFLKYDKVPSKESYIKVFYFIPQKQIVFSRIDFQLRERESIQLSCGVYHLDVRLNGSIVIHVNFRINYQMLYRDLIVESLCVNADQQGKGFGYLAFLIFGLIDGIDRIELVSNQSTVEFYKKIGMDVYNLEMEQDIWKCSIELNEGDLFQSMIGKLKQKEAYDQFIDIYIRM